MRKLLIFGFLLTVFIAPIAFVLAAVQTEPLVRSARAGTAADAKRAKAIVSRLRAISEGNARSKSLKLSQADINSLVAFAARAVPGTRGKAWFRSDAVQVAASLKLPLGRWFNGMVSVAASDRGLNIETFRLGPFDLPPRAVVALVRVGLNLGVGSDVGTILTTSIDGVKIEGRTVVLGVGISDAQREVLETSIKARVRDLAGADLGDVRALYLAMEEASDTQGIRSGGSALPFLRLMMELVQKSHADGGTAVSRQSAFLALAIYCGHRRVQDLVGDVVPENSRNRKTRCDGAKLGGRRDLRQHFVISAGLEAMSNGSVAFTVGEFKELLDSDRGSGFSFDDIAADRAGIRFARVLMEADVETWPRLAERLTEEADVFPDVAGLPAGLSKSEFERRFGDVERAAYKEMLRTIDERIDRLAFFAGGQ